MATTLLRKLTWKSTLKFGRWPDATVQQLFDLGLKERSLLVWYYFNSSNITFMDEILDELKIDASIRIEKPSKDPTRHKWWRAMSLTDNERMGLNSIRVGERNRKLGSHESNDKYSFSRGAMQKRNHGK